MVSTLATLYRGPLVIHASQDTTVLNRFAVDLAAADPVEYANTVRVAIHRHYTHYGIKRFSLGAGIAIAELVDCVLITEHFVSALSEQERALDTWILGRAAWTFANVRMFNDPLPCLGSPGIWTWDGETE